MLNHKGGETVKTGFYLDWRNWRFELVDTKAGTLTGGPDTTYVRVPTVAMLATAPILGGLFVVFLPFVGFALLGEWGWKALRARTRNSEKPAETHS